MMEKGRVVEAHGAWRPVAELPTELRDGRYVLLWVHCRPLVAFWADYEEGEDWSTDDGLRPAPTLFAELAGPNGAGPIYDLCPDD